MPRTLDEIAVQIRDGREFPLLLGAVLLRIADETGANGSEIDELKVLLERERDRKDGRK